jgi:hypothetical protein
VNPHRLLDSRAERYRPEHTGSSRDAVSLRIVVAPEDWGGVQTDDVKLLLASVAQQFVKAFRGPFSARVSIQCRPNRTSAKVECRRWLNLGNNHCITLCTSDCCLWSFQFAHELCHILSDYNRKRHFENAWFQEAMCDLASIFTIRQMALTTWEVPSLNWSWFPTRVQNYARRLVACRDYHLPSGLTFPTWFQANERNLRADRYQRTKNSLIALQLLHLVERSPASWEAIRYMPDTDRTFREFLWRWKEKCPEAQKAFVEEVANTFGIPGWS